MPAPWPRRTSLAIILFGLLAPALPARAAEPQLLIDRARIVVDEFLADPEYATMRLYVQNAYGVLVIPGLLQGGFIIGGEYGQGVILARDPSSGAWSEPAFVDVYGGSIGLQLGGQTTDAVLALMNEGAVEKLLSARFKLGADASGAVGPVGAGVGAGTTVRLGEDFYVFSRNRGLYGGLSVDGTVIVPKNDWNEAYYGAPVTADAIVRGRAVQPRPATQALRDALARY